jgi:diguanylate cyclase (GGDEF)-like protein
MEMTEVKDIEELLEKAKSALKLTDFESAFENVEKAVGKSEAIGDKTLQANARNISGMTHRSVGNLEKALMHYELALNLYEEIEDELGMAMIYNNLATILMQLNRSGAIDYLNKAMTLRKDAAIPTELGLLYTNMSIYYGKSGDMGKSIEYASKSLELYRSIDQVHGIARCLNNLGSTHLQMENYEEAEQCLTESLELTLKHKLPMLESRYVNLGAMLFLQKRFDEALTYLEIGLKTAEKHRNKEVAQKALEDIAKCYAEKKDFITAYENLNAAYELTESVFDKQLQDRINSTEMQFKIRQKERENELLRAMHQETTELNELLKQKNSELQEVQKQLEELVRIDPLTELFNRREILRFLQEEQARINRSNGTLTVILADVDHFKKVNDDYGHDAGDYVLVQLGNIFHENLRNQDKVGRWGGEEFIFLLPETDETGALQFAGKIRSLVEEHEFSYDRDILHVTISMGVSVLRKDMKPEISIKEADLAMYKAKMMGRNQVQK